MNKESFKNRLILASKILLGVIALMLLALIFISNKTKSQDVEIPFPIVIVIAIVLVLTIIIYVTMLVWEIKLSLKESGNYIFGTMVAQFGLIFGVLFLLETFVFQENEPIQSLIGFAATIALSNKSIDFWKRYDKK